MLTFLNELDTQALLAINGWRSTWADGFMYAFSSKAIWIPMYVSILYVIFRNFHWKVTVGCMVAIGLTILFADQVGASIIRPMVERMRPSNLNNPISEWVEIVNGKRGGRYGFPSCHAANTFGISFLILFIFRNRLLSCFMMLWALVTCWSRAYLGVHYPGDLLAGMFLGLIGAALSYWLFSLYCKRIQATKPATYQHLYIPVVVGMLTIVGMAVFS